jgi:hypothetical protein
LFLLTLQPSNFFLQTSKVPLPITLILTLVILLTTSLGIGSALLHFARHKLKLHPAESLCLAVALSWLVIFQFSFAAFALGSFPSAPLPLFILTLIGLYLGRPQLLLWFKNPFTRSMLAAFSLLLAWNLLLQAGNIVYSWGFWYGDWFEHYERMLFFSFQGPLDTKFLEGLYTFPARPPMQNVCQAYVNTLAQTSLPNAFPAFQLSSTFLATLLSLPVFLLTRRMARGPDMSGASGVPGAVWVTAAILASSWPFVVNALFTWTKGFTAFYVLLGLALYLRPPTFKRDLLTFLCLGTAIVVHYSAALLLLPLLLWHAATFIKRPAQIPKAVAAGIPGVLLLLPWVLFVSLAMPGSLMSSTSTADMAQKAGFAQGAAWAAQNALGSLIPFYGSSSWSAVVQNASDTRIENLRALFFMLTQHTWVLVIGFIGILVTGLEAARAFKNKKLPPQGAFWLWLILSATIFTTIVHPTRPAFGLAHIALLPLIAMTAAWVAGAWPTYSKTVRAAFVAAAFLQLLIILIDASVFTSTPMLPEGLAFPPFNPEWVGGQPLPGFDPHRTFDIHPTGLHHLILKQKYALSFLADSLAPHLYTLWLATVLFAIGWLAILIKAASRHSKKHLPSNV